MKPQDKYHLNKKIKNFGKFAWKLLVEFSKISIILFLLLTAFLYWENQIIFLAKQGIDSSKPIIQMLMIETIVVGIVAVDYLNKLK